MTERKLLFKSVAAAVLIAFIMSAIFIGCASSGDDESADSAVTGTVFVISREDGSGTRDAFTELMGITDEDGNDNTVDSAEITSSTSVMMTTVMGNTRAIGYISLGSLSDDVKAVSIDGVEASADTVKDGSYSLQRPFIVAYKEEKLSDLAADFVSFIMSTDGQSIIDEDGYISVGSDYDYTPSGLTGTVTLSGSTSVAPVMNVLADEYKKLNSGVTIEIQEPGSSAGIESALSDAVDIAMSSRELEDDESETLTAVQIALDGIAVIVNNDNPIDNLTASQIKSIFTGEITRWEDVVQ